MKASLYIRSLIVAIVVLFVAGVVAGVISADDIIVSQHYSDMGYVTHRLSGVTVIETDEYKTTISTTDAVDQLGL